MKNLAVQKHSFCKMILPVLFITFKACTPDMIAEQREKAKSDVIAVLIPEPAAEIESQNTSQLVLESGNHWAAGIPGFGENALSGFTGEYRIPEKTETVWIWLTREFIYYDGWTAKNSITSHRVLQKMISQGRVSAASLDEIWTLVVLLPLETELSLEEEDRLITIFIDKFSGFSGQGRNISLPALIPY